MAKFIYTEGHSALKTEKYCIKLSNKFLSTKTLIFTLRQIALFPHFKALCMGGTVHTRRRNTQKETPPKSHLEFDCPAHIVLCSPIFKLPQKPHSI